MSREIVWRMSYFQRSTFVGSAWSSEEAVENVLNACVFTARSCTQFIHNENSPLFNMRNRSSCLSTGMITA